uniref:GTP pyrophosphokinase n=1 Tax=Agathobacter sp. TaxID=2021311 RepID=UPI00405730D5
MTNEEYYELIQPYEDAASVMFSRIKILKHSLYEDSALKSIHNVQERIKSKESIEKKLLKKQKAETMENAKDYLQDISGIRVICYFVKDIYRLVQTIKSQQDLIVIRESDYIKNPKPNGYRSYHMILGVPLYYIDATEYYPVEIQFRTLSMDLWASMEHRIVYKKDIKENKEMLEKLRNYADDLMEIEKQFEDYTQECRIGSV